MKEKMKNAKTKPRIERIVEKNFVAIFLAILSSLTAIANLWSISKLAPVTKDLAVITNRVEAVEAKTTTIVPRAEYSFTVNAITDLIKEWKDETDSRLIRIENKLDRIQ